MTARPGDPPALDWNLRWRQAAASRWRRNGKHRLYWDKRAPSFGGRGQDGTYTRAFLDLLAPDPAWTVLDMGCGTGTLALPLARLVRQVTAVDFSLGMITELERRARLDGLANLHALVGAWEDDWADLGLGGFDVAIASRSLVVEDLGDALRKLDRAARRRVMITSIVGDGPRDRRVMEAVGRPFRRGPDYIYIVNLLHQMEIFANVSFIEAQRDWSFRDRAEAEGFYRNYIEDLDPAEEARLQGFLDRELVARHGCWTLAHPERIRWAVIWWDKVALGAPA